MNRRRKKKKPRLRRRLLRMLLYALLLFVLLSWLPVLALRWLPPPTTAFMIERQVRAWQQHEDDFQLHYRWVPWARMSRQVPLAMVAAEDQKFPHHHGFDLASIRDAIADAADGERLRGASTISQQTAKNLFLWGGRSFVRKGLEAWFTVLIELTWPKQRILEVYANIAELGDGIYGVGAASRHFLHEPADAVTAHQAALLAAVLPNPRRLHVARPSAHVRDRAHWIRQQMQQLGGPAYVTWDDSRSN